MDFIGVFSSIYEINEEKYAFWELNYEFWITYTYYKESTEFESLIALIRINNLFGVKNYI